LRELMGATSRRNNATITAAARALPPIISRIKYPRPPTSTPRQRHPGSHTLCGASKARAAEFDTSFYAVEALELAAGAANIALLGLNMRDGLKMKGLAPSPASVIPLKVRRQA
jgi:hypothetical protein